LREAAAPLKVIALASGFAPPQINLPNCRNPRPSDTITRRFGASGFAYSTFHAALSSRVLSDTRPRPARGKFKWAMR